MSSLVPPNASTALRTLLIATSTFRSYLGGDFVYTPELPAGTTMPTKRVVFRLNGGPPTEPDAPIRRIRANFRCYAESYVNAEKLYGHLVARLHRLPSQTVTVAGERFAFYRIGEDVSPSQLEDPVTGWPYIFSVFGLTVSTMAVESAVS